jgi:hypothetical protein
MYKCCDREFQDKKSFHSHLRSSSRHFLTYSDTFQVELPTSYLVSLLQDREKVVKALGFTPLDGTVVIPLHTKKRTVGGVLKRSLMGVIDGPSIEGGIVKYRLNAGSVEYEVDFRLLRQGDVPRLTTITTFTVQLGTLAKLFPDLVIRGMSSLVLPDELTRSLKRSLTVGQPGQERS